MCLSQALLSGRPLAVLPATQPSKSSTTSKDLLESFDLSFPRVYTSQISRGRKGLDSVLPLFIAQQDLETATVIS